MYPRDRQSEPSLRAWRQSIQSWRPYFPASQDVHSKLAEPLACWPSGHASCSYAPAEVTKNPGLADTHSVARSDAAYFPTEQGEHSLEPERENVPFGHGSCAVAPAETASANLLPGLAAK